MDRFCLEVDSLTQLDKDVLIVLPSVRDTSRLKGGRNLGKIEEPYYQFADQLANRLESDPKVIGCIRLTNLLGGLDSEEGASFLSDGVHLTQRANLTVAEMILEFLDIFWVKPELLPPREGSRPRDTAGNSDPLNKKRARSTSAGGDGKACYRCGKTGHTRSNCNASLGACSRCGSHNHIERNCPARSGQCGKCHKKGHTASKCKSFT